jgi:hypothetical protein
VNLFLVDNFFQFCWIFRLLESGEDGRCSDSKGGDLWMSLLQPDIAPGTRPGNSNFLPVIFAGTVKVTSYCSPVLDRFQCRVSSLAVMQNVLV